MRLAPLVASLILIMAVISGSSLSSQSMIPKSLYVATSSRGTESTTPQNEESDSNDEDEEDSVAQLEGVRKPIIQDGLLA